MRFCAETYAALLGLYLGDGSIVRMLRTHRMRIHLDAKYPGIVGETFATLRTTMPHHSVGLVERHEGRMIDVSIYDSHLPCLFPQHGPGMKHTRPIILEPWQRALVDAAPFDFLRGCIWSDGCCYLNRTGKYVYRSYCFDNRSTDILDLVAEVCEQAGVRCNRNHRSVRIYRRASVALLEEHVGWKA